VGQNYRRVIDLSRFAPVGRPIMVIIPPDAAAFPKIALSLRAPKITAARRLFNGSVYESGQPAPSDETQVDIEVAVLSAEARIGPACATVVLGAEKRTYWLHRSV